MSKPADKWWYSPQCMLLFADLALEHYLNQGIVPPGELQKAIGEGRAGAIFALGLADAFGEEAWMRLVHPRREPLISGSCISIILDPEDRAA